MTLLEAELYQVVKDAIDCFAAGQKAPWHVYMAVMGRMRDVVSIYRNRSLGCPTGKHTSPCTCKPAIRGYAIESIKVKQRSKVR